MFGKDYKHVAEQYKLNLESEGWEVTLKEDERGNWLLTARSTPQMRKGKKA